jgi:chemotaxis response regulator CheB
MPHQASQLHFDIIVLAASAGGLDALTAVLSSLPSDFPFQLPSCFIDPLRDPTCWRTSSADTRRSE